MNNNNQKPQKPQRPQPSPNGASFGTKVEATIKRFRKPDEIVKISDEKIDKISDEIEITTKISNQK